MNQTFSFTRFTRLNRWFWSIKGTTYLLSAGALLLIVLLVISPALNTNNGFSWGIQRGNIFYFFFVALLMTGSIGSDVFSALFRQESAITYLMLPASRTEKFWLGVLYCMVCIVLLSVVYFSYEALVFSIANSRLPATEPMRYVPSLVYNSSPTGDRATLVIEPYALLLALVLSFLGSFFFRRGVLARNVGMVLLIAMGLVLLYKWIVGLQFGGYSIGSSLPFLSVSVGHKGRFDALNLPTWATYSLYAATLLMLWVIARIRFNEIER